MAEFINEFTQSDDSYTETENMQEEGSIIWCRQFFYEKVSKTEGQYGIRLTSQSDDIWRWSEFPVIFHSGKPEQFDFRYGMYGFG